MELNGLKLNKFKVINFLPILLIYFYKIFLSHFFYGNCRFLPSCSEYSMEAFKNFGFFQACKMSFLRIIKCHPFGYFGHDPLKYKNNYSIKKVSSFFIKKYRILSLYNLKQKKLSSYDEDSKKNTQHFVLIFKNKVVSGVTLIESSLGQQYQLRGMFTLKEFRTMGFGSSLLKEIEIKLLKKHKKVVIWCNARVESVNFYKKNNFIIIGKQFYINDIGNHFRMIKKL